MKTITMGRALMVAAIIITLVAFLQQWQPGMLLEYFRQGHPFDRFALVILVLVLFPPLIERLKLPGIIGLMIGGVLLGPQVLAIAPSSNDVASFFSEIGRVFLMFLIGLEINLQDFRKQAALSTVYGVLTFALPMAGGVAVGLAFGYGPNAAILIGSLIASHTLIALPVLARLGLQNAPFAMATVGATILTDIASLLVLAVCLSIHLSGEFDPAGLARLLFGLAVYCVLVLGVIPAIGRLYMKRFQNDEAAQFAFVMLAVIIAAIGAELIDLEDIVGAFLCGVAVNQVLAHGRARDRIEFLGNALFVPIFFVMVGLGLDLEMFADSLTTQLPIVLAILLALFAGKFAAAMIAGLVARFSWNERLGMCSLSLPQLAATLAAAITAFETMNAAGERLIDERVMSAVIVLMVVTASLSPILTQVFAQRIASSRPGEAGV